MTESDVLKILKKSAPKSCDLDPIPTTLLFDCVDVVLPYLTKIINESLISGIFPEVHKTALVTPLLKKVGLDQNVLKNYRPVSNLSFVSKVIEKIVLSQLSGHLSVNKLFSMYQSAYRPGHSTETALVKILNDLLMSMDEGKVSLLTLLDLSAAFDTIDHGILISRLEHVYGISGSALSWFSSYLRDRTQKVKIKNVHSSPVPLVYGVPQGSVLGPVLFVLYMSPLCDVILNHSVVPHSYADDTQLLKSTKSLTNLPKGIAKQSKLNEINDLTNSMLMCVQDVKSWMNFNKLKLNDGKSEVIFIASPRMYVSTPLPNSLVFGSSNVPVSKSARNLGVVIDSNLSMKDHVSSVIRGVNFELRRISSIRSYLTTEATKTLISAFVLSRLDYCNSLYVNCPAETLAKLQRVQNNAARLVLRVPRSDHISPHLRTLHWLPVEARITYKIALMSYRAINLSGPSYLSDLISIYTPTRSLRSTADPLILVTPTTNRSFGERSFSFAAPSIWNDLPLSIRSSDSDSSFRSSLKTYLFKLYFKT